MLEQAHIHTSSEKEKTLLILEKEKKKITNFQAVLHNETTLRAGFSGFWDM